MLHRRSRRASDCRGASATQDKETVELDVVQVRFAVMAANALRQMLHRDLGFWAPGVQLTSKHL